MQNRLILQSRESGRKQKGLGNSPKPHCRPGKAQSFDLIYGERAFFANDFFSKSGAKTLHLARRCSSLRFVCAAQRQTDHPASTDQPQIPTSRDLLFSAHRQQSKQPAQQHCPSCSVHSVPLVASLSLPLHSLRYVGKRC